MKTIHKWDLEITDIQTLNMSKGAKILSVNWQLDRIVLYAGVDTDDPLANRHIYILGTGIPIDPEVLAKIAYIGTIVEPVRKFSWHVFDRGYV